MGQDLMISITTFLLKTTIAKIQSATVCAVVLSFNVLQHDVKQVERLFSITLDMNSWEIAKREIYNKKIKANEMIAEFMENLDEFKEDFKSHYKAVKQYGKTSSGKKDRP